MMRFFRSLFLREQAAPSFRGGFVGAARGLVPGLALGGACLAIGGLGGCSSTATTYYALSSQPGAQAPSLASMALPQVIEMRTPSLTARLDRDGILQGMRRSEDHMIANAMWSEPLSEMVGHTLTANLAQRLPGHLIFSQDDSVAVTPGAYIELSLTRFEEDASGHALISGILSAHHVDTPTEQARAVSVHWVSPQPVRGGECGLLNALDTGLAALADQAVSLLTTLPAPPQPEQAEPSGREE